MENKKFIRALAHKLENKEFIRLNPPIIKGWYKEASSENSFCINQFTDDILFRSSLKDFFSEQLDFKTLDVIDLSDSFPLYDHDKDSTMEYWQTVFMSGYYLNEGHLASDLILSLTRGCLSDYVLLFNCAGYLTNENDIIGKLKKEGYTPKKVILSDIDDSLIRSRGNDIKLECPVEVIRGDVLSASYPKVIKDAIGEDKLVSVFAGNSVAGFSYEQIQMLLKRQNEILKKNGGYLAFGSRYTTNFGESLEEHINHYVNAKSCGMFKQQFLRTIGLKGSKATDDGLSFMAAYDPTEKDIVSGLFVHDLTPYIPEGESLGRLFGEGNSLRGKFLALNRSKVFRLHGTHKNSLTNIISSGRFTITRMFDMEDIYRCRRNEKTELELSKLKEYDSFVKSLKSTTGYNFTSMRDVKVLLKELENKIQEIDKKADEAGKKAHNYNMYQNRYVWIGCSFSRSYGKKGNFEFNTNEEIVKHIISYFNQ